MSQGTVKNIEKKVKSIYRITFGNYTKYNVYSNAKDTKFKIDSHVKISKYKNILLTDMPLIDLKFL